MMKKLLILFFLLGFLTACTSNKDIPKNDMNLNKDKEEETVKDDNNNLEEIVIKKEDNVSNDEYIISYFNDLDKETDNYIASSNNEKISDKLKNSLIKVIDFLFYDEEIGGVRLKDITSKTKEEVMIIFNRIDQKLEEHFPSYKEFLGEKYNTAVGKVKEYLEKADNYLEEKIGEDKYNNYKEKANEILDNAKDIGNTLKEKGQDALGNLKKWYEEKTNK